ncbi:uncharacterized protein LOC130709816 [Lotus japonicus]|uniref:uncharacterized protein LOC130709816 n=1 Tax=Lotus japonicus TaxID=34305 RepID=UPI0025902B6E|nr:uncharacterized protein LOC130709816 [Lotus japonicus]
MATSAAVAALTGDCDDDWASGEERWSSHLHEGREDKWKWVAEDEGCYTVKYAYSFLQGHELEEEVLVFVNLWRGLAPSNVLAFVWKFLWGMLPSKCNLAHREILPQGASMLCHFCQEVNETSEHLLLNCPFSSQVWKFYRRWMGICTFQPRDSREHFAQHGGELTTRNQRQGAQTVWFAVLWSIWKMRNNLIFRNGEKDVERVWDLAQLRAWNWLKSRCPKFKFSVYEWISNPRYCLESL